MRLLLLPSLLLFAFVATAKDTSASAANGNIFKLLDLESVEYLMQPKPDYCSNSNEEVMVMVHSAPANSELRMAVRETWGSVKGFRTAFLLGAAEEDLAKNLIVEQEKYGDLIQGSFVDAYRNMTYKHLLGYRWILDNCPRSKMVLKSDDDQAIDTFHLPVYITKFITETVKEPFILCYIIANKQVHRDETDKWFVTRAEYPGDTYPNYCAGWAYVTNYMTMELIMSAATEAAAVAKAAPVTAAKGEEMAEEVAAGKFWIDDVFVTGMLRPESVRMFDWSRTFLNKRISYEKEILEGSLFTPELMVASDLKPEQIRRLFFKFKQSERDGWVQQIYQNSEVIEVISPKLVTGTGKKDEL